MYPSLSRATRTMSFDRSSGPRYPTVGAFFQGPVTDSETGACRSSCARRGSSRIASQSIARPKVANVSGSKPWVRSLS